MKPVKKSLLVVASICCLITAGVTYALLSKVTETATNTFSSDRSISLKLREDKWDGYGFGVEYPSNIVPGSDVYKEAENQEQLGLNIAKNYHPGDDIPKNPTVKNTGNEPIYVAIKVIYEDGNGKTLTKNEFERKYGGFYSIEFGEARKSFNSNFTEIATGSNYDLFVYNNELESDGETASLFDQVKINKDIQSENGKWPTFNIKIKAYAIQKANVDFDLMNQNCEAFIQLRNLAGSN